VTATAEFVTTIGLEIHVELKTSTKMFCGCPVAFGGEPNTRVCPICLGHPGTLPVPNEKAIEFTTKIAMALDCEIAPYSIFHRKNYFYPDMPKNYQISQYDIPIGSRGVLEVQVAEERKRVGITRVHLEEDTGKSIHVGGGGRIREAEYSLEDFNRAGTPLVEIVTEPDITSAEEARAFAQELRSILEYLDVSDVRMEEGSLRIDANVSLAPKGERGVKIEVKNMNSMRSLFRALQFEEERQRNAWLKEEKLLQMTRHWDEKSGETIPGRMKEYAFDYRYFPEPDLTPIEPSVEWLRQLQEELPELPSKTRARWIEELGLGAYDAQVLSSSKSISTFFEETLKTVENASPKQVANWIANNLAGALSERGREFSDLRIAPREFAELVDLVARGDVNASQAKEVLTAMLESGGSASAIASERGMRQLSDRGELEAIVDQVIQENQEVAEKIRSGDSKPMGVLVGQVMRATKGQANPAVVNEILRDKLGQ
jgi:aspartyl-tRNA(Asn)/glutamyl-tRNA(Gln) amidotransferase subunit B